MRESSHPHPSPVRPGRRRLAGPVTLLAVTALGLGLLATGCSMEDASCSDHEYGVISVGGTGSACVSDDEEPPKGYTRYPEGKEPQHVGDEWDTYWQTHTVDENGRIIEVPDAAAGQ
ncbi:SCO0607 family lipoprotein [Streptomyces sp. NPDC008313]|uniref:SCO0607 family lipoprotein n=1 Tax=Streptomyces sp. NPDC008313 TaxID=3364826 RepID=UPI0036EAD542